MGTRERRFLDNFLSHIKVAGGRQFLQLEPYEGSHNVFKSLYEKSSEIRFDRSEIVYMPNPDSATDLTETAFINTCKSKYFSRVYLVNANSAIVERIGAQTCLAELEYFLL